MTDKKPDTTARRAILVAVVLIFVAATGWFQLRHFIDQGHEIAQPLPGVQIGGPFTLTDHNGERVTDETYRGKYLLVYFGYTFCPDVCPTELTIIVDALDRIGPLADKIQPILITVDPARDTAEALKPYVAAFHPRLVGLTGTEEEIASVARSYRAYYARADEEGDKETYLVDHSALTYLMGPDGEFLTTFSYGSPAETVAKGLRKFIQN
ncbi:MAG: SCO family protein [Rhodospirillales bacterium]|nr:SCO family protein [Rhodospirillales bacterium]MCW8861623.1 SCO family protein [Rhodospirillales bacterium]MCW8952128.1 SCO family protein [Rhodospirillales bacterium]MCW8970599.1 SCO family protein [Rhodospirillales bacterium]